MPSNVPSGSIPADIEHRLGLMQKFRYPETKTGYLLAYSLENPVEFPLTADLENDVPNWLPGALPQSELDLLQAVPKSA